MIRTARARPFVGRRIFYVPSTPSPSQIAPPRTAPLRLPQPTNFSRIGRRYNHNAAKDVVQPTAQASPEAPKSIPGPSWLWLEPVYEPFRAYGRIQQRRPYWTQFISSLVIYFVGDVVAQSVSAPDKPTSATVTPTLDSTTNKALAEDEDSTRGWVQIWMEDRDWARTARALFIGGAAAVPGYRWFLWLSNSFNYKSKVLSLTTKVVVNQLTFTPLFNTYFFGTQSFLSGATPSEAWERIKNTVPTSWYNSCKLWPAITAFMFVYVPLPYRSIFGGVIAIGWQTYLSLLNQRAAKEESAQHAHEHDAKDRILIQKEHAAQRREECTA